MSETPTAEEPRPGRNMGTLASRGAALMFGLNVTSRLLGLVRTAIIARLLLPSDLGLFGIALLVQTMIETFTMFGVNSALVRHPDDIRPYLDTAWVIAFVRALGVAVIMVLAAPLVADFFHQPRATILIRVLAISVVFGGFINPAVVTMQRQLRFGRLYVFTIIPSLADIGVSIAVAAIYRTAMALILGLVANYAVQLVFSYFITPLAPRLHFHRARARELMSYGRWITGSTILRFLYGNGDDIVVGRLLGATSLGIYQIGYKYSNLPTTEITRTLHMVAVPVYAKMQKEPERLKRAFLEAAASTALVSIALAGYIWVITPDFVHLVLGSRWQGVIPVMRLLAMWGAAESVSEIPIALFEAVGVPQLETRRLLAKAVLLAALIYPFLLWRGLNGVCVAVLISSIPTLIWSLVNACRIAKAPGRQVTVIFLVPVIGVAVAVAAAIGLGYLLPTGSIWSLVALTALSAAAYAVVILVARAFGYTGASQLARRLWSSFGRRSGTS